VRFCARRGPPARGPPLRFAHLYAAAPQMRLRAAAVASAGGNLAQHCRGIGEKCHGAGQQRDSQTHKLPEGRERRLGCADEAAHGGILLRGKKKTDSSGSSENVLLGSWNCVKGWREVRTTGRRPDSVAWSSELNQECGIGVRRLRGENCKFHIMKHLFR
jgi:hypothetical protein